MGKQNGKREEWATKVKDYEESGLSMRKWCELHGEKEHQLKYYREAQPIFEEIKDKPEIKIQIGEISIEMPADIDTAGLNRCIRAAQVIAC